MVSQETYNKIFLASMVFIAFLILYVSTRPPPTINDIFRNSNMLDKDNADHFVKNVIMSLDKCASPTRQYICDTCRRPDRPREMNAVSSSPEIIGACTGV